MFIWNKQRHLNALSPYVPPLWSCLHGQTDGSFLEKSLHHYYTKQTIQNTVLLETLINFCTNRQCTTSGPTKMNFFLEDLFLSTAAFSSSHPSSYPISKDTWIQSLHFNMIHLPFETYKAHNAQCDKSTKTLILRTSSGINRSW